MAGFMCLEQRRALVSSRVLVLYFLSRPHIRYTNTH
jgi:hypothetical protein